MLVEMLNKIDKREYLTEEEHKKYIDELHEALKLFDDLTSGNMISYNGKFVAMNKKKYHEYRERQLVSAEAVAFIQHKNQQLENLFNNLMEKGILKESLKGV